MTEYSDRNEARQSLMSRFLTRLLQSLTKRCVILSCVYALATCADVDEVRGRKPEERDAARSSEQGTARRDPDARVGQSIAPGEFQAFVVIQEWADVREGAGMGSRILSTLA